MMKRLGTFFFVILCMLTLLLGYQFAKTNIAADFYRDRLREAVKENEKLRQTFNEAVKKTIVTELVVNDDESVCVVFVNADNTERVVPTPYKMGREVFADYIIRDNKLMLRRIFDQKTTPEEALYVNPDLQTVKWKAKDDTTATDEGIAVYTQLNQKGRWTVSVTGNGRLTMVKADDSKPRQPIVALPPVKDYPVIEKEMNDKVDEIGVSDVVKSLFGGPEKK